MRKFAIFLFTALVVAPLVSPAAHGQTRSAWAAETGTVDLEVGGTHTLNAEGVRSFSEGVRGIANVKLTTDSRQFVISGRKPGTTSLLLIYKDGRQEMFAIHVFPRSPGAVLGELSRLLEGSIGLRVRRIGTRFFIEGGVATKEEEERVQKIAALYPGQVEALVTVGAAAADRGINIQVDFYFIEYNSTTGWRAGVDWPGSFAAGSVLQGQYDLINQSLSASFVMDQALPALDLASSAGTAKVLRHTRVITSNGNVAEFESGGEENFRVEGGFSSTIQAIAYGAKVSVLPRLDPESSRIDLTVQADVADLKAPANGTNLPSRSTSKLNTAVRIKLGQAFVLSGIRVKSQRRARKGIPLLSEIPILGLLFGSARSGETEREGAVIVVPTAVESVARPAQELIDQALDDYVSFDGAFGSLNAIPENRVPQFFGRSPEGGE